MRSAILFTAFCASLALSKPIERRAYVTVEDIVTVYTTVTEGAVPTPVTGSEDHHFHPHPPPFTYIPVTTSTTPVAVSSSTPVEVPPPASTPVDVPPPASTPYEVPAPTPSSAAPEVEPTTTEPAPPPPSSTSAAVATSTPASGYQGVILDQHNLHRSNHSAVELTWNATLAATALKIAQTCVYAHNVEMDGGGYGQNIGAGAAPAEIGSMITDEMYNGEIGFYPTPYGVDSPDMSNFESWGHFSQIVWKDTVSIGCATYQCSTLENVSSDVEPYFTVCNYYPPGNYEGEYSKVGSPLGHATVTA